MKVNDHPHSGWLEFSTIGGKRQKHISALIVANETGRLSTRFETTNQMNYPAAFSGVSK